MLTDNPTAPQILIVEDDENHAELIQRSFEDAPEEYRLQIVSTLRDAHKAIQLRKPALVLTDYRLPDGSGSELVVADAGGWPVIIMTSHGSEQVAVEAMKIGAQDYIVKSPEVFANLPRTVKYSLMTWALVVERKQAVDAALRAKKDWEKTFDAVPDLISIMDLNQTITRVNKAMAERCGLTPRELVGRKCYEVVHGLHDSPACCPVDGMIRYGQVHTEEIEEKKFNSFFNVTVSPIHDDEGHTVSYVHVMRDITSNKIAEAALAESEEKHRKLANEQRIILNTSSVGICFLKDRKVLWANPAFDVIFGYEAGTTRNLGTSEFYADHESYEFIGENGYSTIESGAIFSQDVIMKKKDGSLIWCNLVGQAVSPGKREDGSIWIMQDISERKRAEEALRNSEKNYRNLMENVPAVIYIYSSVHGGVFYSPQVEQVFGYSLQEFYDNPLLWKNSIHPDDVGSVEKTIGAIFDGEQGFDIEYRVCNKSGEWIWLHDSSIQYEVTDGEIVIHGIAQNITKLKQAEEERKALEAQFQQTQKLESLGVLAGGIAHDFNNILTIILGHCFMVKDNFDSDMSDKDHVVHIESAANRAADLCRQMLAYAGKSQQCNVQINLWLMIDEIVKMLQSAIRKNVAIQLELKRDVPEISGDNAQIQQIIMNLLINAAEAIGNRNGTIRVVLKRVTITEEPVVNDFFGTVIPAGSYACLEVCDNGCGMDEKTQIRIFEPFFTTKLTGRGLGMSAILGIIKSHDGALQLSSSIGVGTTFKIFFPLPVEISVVESAQLSGSTPLTTESGTVLLVDDEEALRTVGAALLGAMDFSVVTASNGREALDIYRKQGSEIDLILLDLIMPEMGGAETYHELRKLNKDVPIVICSGYGVEEIMKFFDADTCVGSIQKPYKPEQLRSTLLNMLKTTTC
jgi:PAS domain S-box-containing protein